MLRIFGDGGFYVGGIFGTGAIPLTGAGSRLMWYPAKAAFRVGAVGGDYGNYWDNDSIGAYSFASGWNSRAIGDYSTAMGFTTTARGRWSIAMGYITNSTADASTAMGLNTTASGRYSTAMGQSTIASYEASTAMGHYTQSTGFFTTSMGDHTAASGNSAIAMGYSTTASGNYSTAVGSYVSTYGKLGACIIGDATNEGQTNSSADNQMTMRFAGGYRLFTNSSEKTGVYMDGGVSGWTNYCDRNKKENFSPVNGEALLKKIREIPITEWSYKGTDPTIRYIGPVAQDFYAAFHLGGTDSLGINTICIDGVNMAAIQALEKRTSELQKATAEIAELEKIISKQQTELASCKKTVDELKDEFVQLKKQIAAVMELKKSSSDVSIASMTPNK